MVCWIHSVLLYYYSVFILDKKADRELLYDQNDSCISWLSWTSGDTQYVVSFIL